MSEGLAEANPFAGTTKRVNDNGGRTRVPTLGELVEIWRATDADSDYGSIIRMLMLTGMRRNEVGDLRWAEIDLDNATITLPATRMKHNRENIFTLPAAAVEILRNRTQDGRYVFGRTGESGFSGWSRALKALRARILARRRAADPNAGEMPHFQPHDFRRSVSTIMGDTLDVPPHIVSEILAHTTFKAGSEAVYNKGKYLPQKRAAVERWAAYLLAAVEGGAGGNNVIPMEPLPAHRG
jgi:integrase